MTKKECLKWGGKRTLDLHADIPSRKREGQRGLRACSLAAAGWASARLLAHPQPLPPAGGETNARNRSLADASVEPIGGTIFTTET